MEFPASAEVFTVKLFIPLSLAVMALGWKADGSWNGAAAWGIILGVLWFIWEFMHHDPKPKQPRLPEPVELPDGDLPATRGRRNPDPTRPESTDDFMGMATEYINRKRGM
jgi:hypothetical protein